MAWKGITGAAAMAVLAWGSAAYAVDSQAATADTSGSSGGGFISNALLMDDTTTAPAAAAAPAASTSAPSGPTTLTPLMFALDPTSFGQWMEKNNLKVTGFVEGGYWYDTNNPNPAGSTNPGTPTFVTFPGQYSNQILLDQADIQFIKTIDTTKQWDWGFLVEAGYGVDFSYTHSSGLLDNRPPGNPQNQGDLVQANLSLLAPLGSGLTITAGKFVGFLSYEVINPTGNAFYTHSYNFFYGVPATNTGVTGSYTFGKAVNGHDLTITAGVTRGWNQTMKDNNGAVDFLGQAKSNITDTLAYIFNLEVGPNGTHDNGNWWTTPELILTDQVSDQLSVAGDFLYSDYPNGAPNRGGSAQWYGAVLYGGYKLSPMLTFNLRGEWYRDQGGFTTGFNANYYEVTSGVQIHPLPDSDYFQWLQIRPELRYDWSDKRVYDAVGDAGAGNHGQFSVGVDVIMQF
jgi:hypothetical protein